MPALVNLLRDDPNTARRRTGVVLDYVVPPGYQSHYGGLAWVDLPTSPTARGPVRMPQRPVVDYPESRKALFMNIGYGALYFLAGAVFFTRRDVQLG